MMSSGPFCYLSVTGGAYTTRSLRLTRSASIRPRAVAAASRARMALTASTTTTVLGATIYKFIGKEEAAA